MAHAVLAPQKRRAAQGRPLVGADAGADASGGLMIGADGMPIKPLRRAGAAAGGSGIMRGSSMADLGDDMGAMRDKRKRKV